MQAQSAAKRPRRSNKAAEAASCEVRIRMYRVGLGDCFLLSFQEPGGTAHVLIDCGTLGSEHPDLSADTKAVAADIRQVTDGRLDLVIATHEHADHLSGFRGNDNPFKGIGIGEVWMSWCERPGDGLAGELRTRKKAELKALQAGLARLKAAGSDKRLGALDAIMAFGGELGLSGVSWTAQALDFLREHAETVTYHEPGTGPLPLPRVAGVRAYVLGPPRDPRIYRLYEEGATYGLAAGAADEGGQLAAMAVYAGLCDADHDPAFGDALPFDARHPARLRTQAVRDAGEAGTPAMLHAAYYGSDWRQIEEDWLDSPEGLALKLDNATNNTSLALAFELPDGRVLLFPGDAQVGNWESWQDWSWPGRDGQKLTAADLLARTVLYKVGHHGSHNATLRAQGLELMTSADLVAMLPVDEDFAHLKKGWLRMPLTDLTARLEEKTQGRVIRADRARSTLEAKKGADDPGWQAFLAATRTKDDRLYIEHVIAY